MPPPELMHRMAPLSAGELMLDELRAEAPVSRHSGPRAEAAYWRARLEERRIRGDEQGEREAAISLARLLASRGIELDLVATLARRALVLGDDTALRTELAGWLAGLGESAAAASVLRGVCDVQRPSAGARTLVRIAVLLARAGDASGAVDALVGAASLEPTDAMASELLGTVSAWASDLVSAEAAAKAYLDAAERHETLRERDAAFEDRLRALEIAPHDLGAATIMSAALAARGRLGAADEAVRAHAVALTRRGEIERALEVHVRRLEAALSDGDAARAAGCAFDAELEADVDAEDVDVIDEVLGQASLYELVAARKELRAERLEGTQRAAVFEVLARLYAGPLASPDRAIESWIEAAVNDPGGAYAWVALRDHAAALEDSLPLLEALIRVADSGERASNDPRDVLNALRELASLAEDKVDDPGLACWAFERMLRADAEEEVAAAGLQRLAERARAQDEALSEAQATLRSARSSEMRVHALRKLVTIYRGRPDDLPSYEEALTALAQEVPSDHSCVLALDRLARRAGTGGALVHLLEGRLAQAEHQARSSGGRAGEVQPPGMTRIELVRARLMLAAVHRRAGDEDRALSVVLPLLTEAPGHRGAASAALLFATRTWRVKERADALVQLAGPVWPALRAVLLASAAELYVAVGELGLARKASELACEADPTSARAVATRAHALIAGHDVESSEATARSATPAAVRSDRLAAASVERAITTVFPRGTLCDGLARMLEGMGEHGLALGWTQRWLALHPGCIDATRHLIRRATSGRDAARLSDALAWVLAQPRPLGEMAPVLAAGLNALQDLDTTRAAALARRALDVFGPGIPSLREELLELAGRARDWQLKVAVLERSRAADHESSRAHEALLLLADGRIDAGDPSGAARDLARAAERGASPEEVLARIERLDTWLQDATVQLGSDGIVSLTEARARALTVAGAAAEAAAAWRELGSLLWDLADDRRGAEEAFYRACELVPRGGEERYARDLRAFAGIEQAIDILVARAGVNVEPPPTATGAPHPALTGSPSPRKHRASLLVEAASMAVEHGLMARALAVAASAIEIDPTRADAVALVERCAEDEEAVETLHHVYGLLANAALGCYGRRAAHYRAARQLERRGAIHLAFLHAAASFESVPTEGTTYVLLARLAERVDDPAEAVRVIARVAAEEEPDVRSVWLKRAATLAGSSEEGLRTRIDLLLRALNVRPDSSTVEDVGQALRELVAMTGEVLPEALRFDRAIKATLPKLDGPDGARAAIAMAKVAVEVLGSSASALAAIERAMRVDGDVEEFDSLVNAIPQLALEAERAQHLIAAIYAAAKNAHVNVGPPLLRWASRLADTLNVPDVAAALLVEAARRAPENSELAFEADVSVQLAGDDTLLRALDEALPVARRVESLLYLADQHEREGRTDRVILALERALETGDLEEATRSSVVTRLRRLLSASGRIHDLEALLRQELRRDDLSQDLLRSLSGELTDLLAARGAFEDALQALCDAALRLPFSVTLLDRVRDLSKETGTLRPYVDVLTRYTTLVEDVSHEGEAGASAAERNALHLSLLRELAPLEQMLGDRMAASAHYQAIVHLDPRDTEALVFLEAEATDRSDYRSLGELLALRISAATSVEERCAMMLRRAAILEQHLGLLQEACDELRMLLASTPGDVIALRYLGNLHERLGEPLQAAPRWEQLSDYAQTVEEQAEYVLRACRAYLDGGEIDAAVRCLGSTKTQLSRRSELEVRVEIARRKGDALVLADVIEELASVEDFSDERRAELLVEAARMASGAGNDLLALERARRALQLSSTLQAAILEARRLEYRLCGAGTPREAQAAIEELQRVAADMEPAQVELYAFLLAEHLDVIQGHGAGMRELARRHAEIGPAPLIALGMAERLALKRNFVAALPLFERALGGELQGLRSRGRVALAAAQAAERVGDLDAAARLLEEAAAEPDTRALAVWRQLELTVMRGEPGSAGRALEELANRSSGPERARMLTQLATLLVDTDAERSQSLLSEAELLGAADRSLKGRIADLRIKLEAVRSERALKAEPHPEGASPRPGPPPLPVEQPQELAAAAAEEPKSDGISPSRSRSRPRASSPVRLAFDHAEIRVPLTQPAVQVTPAPASYATEPSQPLQGSAIEQSTFNVTGDDGSRQITHTTPNRNALSITHGAISSTYPPLSAGRLLSIAPPAAASDEEAAFFQDILAGDYDAGEHLIALFQASGEPRTREVLAVRRMQAVIRLGDRDVLERLHAAALDDKNHVYARSVEHVLRAFDVVKSEGSGGALSRIIPPPLSAQRDAPELVGALLFRDIDASVNEALAIVWETGLFRRDAGQFGLTGLERVQPGLATVLGEVYGMVAERLGCLRTPLFHQRQAAGRTSLIEPQVLPLLPPAVMVRGDIRQETAELRYLLGAHLTGAKSEHVLACSLSTEELQTLLSALVAAFGPLNAEGVPRKDPAVIQLEQNLWQLIPPRGERRLRQICSDQGISHEIAMHVSHLAMRRAGLYAAGDLTVAIHATIKECGINLPIPLSSPNGLAEACSTHPEIADLVRMAIRMEYAEARWQPEPVTSVRRTDSLRPRSRTA